jgi:uncharacterized protein (DUF1330 family)
MSAFFLFHNKRVNDPARLARYKDAVAPLVERFGGTYRVIGGNPRIVEGGWRPEFLVLIEFPSAKRAAEWYESDDYRELKAERLAAVDSEGLMLTGLDEA